MLQRGHEVTADSGTITPMQDRFAEMQQRMLRNYRNAGIGMIVASPVLFIVAPFGMFVGPLVGVLGILSVARAASLAGNMKKPPPV
jgi:hypothetical protein